MRLAADGDRPARPVRQDLPGDGGKIVLPHPGERETDY